MRNLLDLVYEYRNLLAVAGEGAALAPQEARQLRALERLFGKEPGEGTGATRHRKYARCDIELTGTMRVDGRSHQVKVLNLGGGGICISPAPQMEPGEIATLHLVDEERSREFFYKVRAGWAHRQGRQMVMGMPFVGRPDVLSPRRRPATASDSLWPRKLTQLSPQSDGSPPRATGISGYKAIPG